MKRDVCRLVGSKRGSTALALSGLLGLVGLLGAPAAVAHSPLVDSNLTDWCLGTPSYAAGAGRIEDSYANLVCGNCSSTTSQACLVNSDCPSGQSCVNMGSKSELVWWDDRTDGAVNDLGTIAMTQDNTNLYISAQLWVDPDPVSLPFGEVALDTRPGGKSSWHDPASNLSAPGHCSVSTDRGCTSDADCHFCAISTEPYPSTRVRACGSGCDPDLPGDDCITTQTCTALGAGGSDDGIGLFSDPQVQPDYLILFDFSFWLIGADGSTLLMEDVGGNWTAVASFNPAVNPGASGGSGGPPGAVEVAIPWSAFGCTGCPAACSCPGFGPGQDFSFSMIVARGATALDYVPSGAIEDVMSEDVAGTTTTTTNDCFGFGLGNTLCELADGSADAFVPPPVSLPGGRAGTLLLSLNAAPSVTLTWGASCSSADTDYEVYEGVLGNWYSHVPVAGLCSTAGALSATFDASAGDRYYIVVPTDGATEGSYGVDGASAERPVSGSSLRSAIAGHLSVRTTWGERDEEYETGEYGRVDRRPDHESDRCRLAAELDGSASIVFDQFRVPTVVAQTEHDALFLQGYMHARDRLFQMDLQRRLFSGTLSELVGPSGLPQDVQLRTLGLRRAAQRSLAVQTPETMAWLQAYADGVNAYIDDPANPLPLEYSLLETDRAGIPPWTPLDSLTMAKGLAFGLSFDLEDIDRTLALLNFLGVGDVLGFNGLQLFNTDLYRTAPFDPTVSIQPGMAAPEPNPEPPADESLPYYVPPGLRHAGSGLPQRDRRHSDPAARCSSVTSTKLAATGGSPRAP